ncbi:hypothetical protein M9Y10_038987 [Tritrichomonas musculus]|uniref:DUF3447 domain-containing protein n=1 Tax=Tritrichomonas musculus TaxID=1915356 RepID=A0ABR2KAP7_9EUKA
MSISDYLEKMKVIQSYILSFITGEDNIEEDYANLLSFLIENNFRDDQYNLKALLYLVVKISDSHNRDSCFFDKIEKILLDLKIEIEKYFSNSEIFNIFKSNKRILLFLIQQKIMTIDKHIIELMLSNKYKIYGYPQYFSPEIYNFISKNKISKNLKNQILNEILKHPPDDFEEKRKSGENDDSLCQMIREDLIDEFLSFVNQNNFSLNSTIKNDSIYETNLFLLQKRKKSKSITLIEYAAFFGSIQIFKYLFLNKADLPNRLMIFAVHGDHPEIIRILEENLENQEEMYLKSFKESIKCHHKDISNYIINNHFQNNEEKIFKNLKASVKYYNYSFIPEKDMKCALFPYLCKYNHYYLVKYTATYMNVELNAKIIFKKKIFFL